MSAVKQTLRHAKRLVILVIGSTLALGGIALLVLPGPGWLVIIAGLAVLATEFAWAARLLESAKRQARRGARAVSGRFRRGVKVEEVVAVGGGPEGVEEVVVAERVAVAGDFPAMSDPAGAEALDESR